MSNRSSVLTRPWIFFCALTVLYFLLSSAWLHRLSVMLVWAVGALLSAAYLFLCYSTVYSPLKRQEEVLRKIWRDKDRKQEAELILNRESELFALQSQIKPHFLYNTLDSIRGQAIIDGTPSVASMTEALSNFFRYSISTKGNFVTLSDEIKSVRNYFLIQQFRFNNRFELHIKDDGDESYYEYILPKITLQPIVENAIYHGLEPKLGKGTIIIRITHTESNLTVRVSDNGVGMEQERLDRLRQNLLKGRPSKMSTEDVQGTGIALTNVNRRIQLNFGKWYGISADSIKDLGTDIEIVLPVVTDMDGVAVLR